MEVSAKISRSEVSTAEVNSVSRKTQTSAENVKSENVELESYFNPQDKVEISAEAQKLNAQSDSKIATLSAKTENFTSDTSNSSQKIKIKQIAALMSNGKNVSSAEEKLLKEADPQLYARIKAKLKMSAKN